MSRLTGIGSVLLILLLAMGFAAANAGNRATLELGIVTLYQVPVTLVAFSGLIVGMLAMFATGIHTDLKVRQILRERLSQESKEEQSSIDRNQQDLFSEDTGEIVESPAALVDPDPVPAQEPESRPDSSLEGTDPTE
jgi:uncharacterized integral membrane protein